VSLPPGRYQVTEWRGDRYTSRLRTWFDVLPGRVVYIGVLQFVDAGEGFLFHKGAWSLGDGGEKGLRAFGRPRPGPGA
jgi:hypothetical protein